MNKLDCRSLTEKELIEVCESNSIKKFRANQIFRWIQEKGIAAWEEMTNIGKQDREKLRKLLYLEPLELLREQCSKDGTRKFLFRLADGESIESVLMNYENSISRDRSTVCISTQVGCPVGCSFCATGMEGFKRNLTVGEITGQVLDIFRHISQNDPEFKVTNIVFMGMGEPLLNYDAVLKAIRLFNSENGQNIGMRRMTVSTSGVVPKIKELAEDNSQVGLAVSLHSAQDKIRDFLVPMNKKYPLPELMTACRIYSESTGRRVTMEMALSDKNTHKDEAEKLVGLLKGMLVHVNLIPVNPVKGSNDRRPAREKIQMFKKILEAGGVPVSIREEKGLDIDAACGQLRQRLECENYESVNQS